MKKKMKNMRIAKMKETLKKMVQRAKEIGIPLRARIRDGIEKRVRKMKNNLIEGH